MANENNISLQCTFTQECVIGETCQSTDFKASLSLTEEAQNAIISVANGVMTTDAETLTLRGLSRDGQLSLNGAGVFPVSHHFTVWSDAQATYTTHISSEFSVTYMGSCQ
ncbi:hypothetical protein [Nereida sp. MMG025]|uniref:hypothetical protein n=1 Tax=Nereida sp. MMG025 TaxID=2909981 RepID=UPI001F1B2FDA|nr:hypothetical protein [Nereida sp. MMG025]MCF6443327.1 hypothetical protein [Nereida sp. MMG025]